MLPGSLKEIGVEAFMNVSADSIVIPDGTISIASRAFADCPNLSYIFIPMSVEDIADDAFDGCESSLTIHCIEGSFAQEYAYSHEIWCVTQ